jgi:hypothetical protein
MYISEHIVPNTPCLFKNVKGPLACTFSNMLDKDGWMALFRKAGHKFRYF